MLKLVVVCVFTFIFELNKISPILLTYKAVLFKEYYFFLFIINIT